ASRSPRRAELLRAAGFSFDTLVVDVDETRRPGEEPAALVRRLAMEKSARALAMIGDESTLTTEGTERTWSGILGERADLGGSVKAARVAVLGADTTVVVNGDMLGKPRDDEEAAWMLRRLSGRRHQVLTGVSLRRPGVEAGGVDTTAVEVT